jgi:PhnB protein
MAVEPIPDGYHSVTPVLTVEGAAKLIEFLRRAFGAEELLRVPGVEGAIMHAEVRIGDSIVMLTDAVRDVPMPTSIFLYVDDADAVYESALKAGATSLAGPADMFWGDRFARVMDPLGNLWSISTHIRDVPPEELQERSSAAAE